MPRQVTMGAMLKCSMGSAPSSLVVLPMHKVLADTTPAANITDHLPMVNIMPFGMCQSTSNPAVVAATAAAMGAMTPMACVPATLSPWSPGAPTVLLDGNPSLDNVSKCKCMWGGEVSVQQPATEQILIP